jgi:hypothetical protein
MRPTWPVGPCSAFGQGGSGRPEQSCQLDRPARSSPPAVVTCPSPDSAVTGAPLPRWEPPWPQNAKRAVDRRAREVEAGNAGRAPGAARSAAARRARAAQARQAAMAPRHGTRVKRLPQSVRPRAICHGCRGHRANRAWCVPSPRRLRPPTGRHALSSPQPHATSEAAARATTLSGQLITHAQSVGSTPGAAESWTFVVTGQACEGRHQIPNGNCRRHGVRGRAGSWK